MINTCTSTSDYSSTYDLKSSCCFKHCFFFFLLCPAPWRVSRHLCETLRDPWELLCPVTKLKNWSLLETLVYLLPPLTNVWCQLYRLLHSNNALPASVQFQTRRIYFIRITHAETEILKRISFFVLKFVNIIQFYVFINRIHFFLFSKRIAKRQQKQHQRYVQC